MHSIASSVAGARRWSRPLVSAWTIAALALAALWVNPLVVTVGFALVSTGALRELVGPGQRVALLYLCVPLQYGFVASDAYGPMTLALPLVATLALPLWSVGTGDVRALAERSAQRYFALMIAVYALSYVPALAMVGDSVSAAFATTSWPLAIAAVAVMGLVAAGGARVMARIGMPQLRYVGAVAFPAPLAYHFAAWIASRTTG